MDGDWQYLRGEFLVSMKSGLRDRNNPAVPYQRITTALIVSMKSGLRDRNNYDTSPLLPRQERVSMKSGLRDRNNGGGF